MEGRRLHRVRPDARWSVHRDRDARSQPHLSTDARLDHRADRAPLRAEERRSVARAVRSGRGRRRGASAVDSTPQLTAFFSSAPILASSAAVSSFSAKEVGHMADSSRFALSLKPSVAYLALNLCALWKKHTTLPSLA